MIRLSPGKRRIIKKRVTTRVLTEPLSSCSRPPWQTHKLYEHLGGLLRAKGAALGDVEIAITTRYPSPQRPRCRRQRTQASSSKKQATGRGNRPRVRPRKGSREQRQTPAAHAPAHQPQASERPKELRWTRESCARGGPRPLLRPPLPRGVPAWQRRRRRPPRLIRCRSRHTKQRGDPRRHPIRAFASAFLATMPGLAERGPRTSSFSGSASAFQASSSWVASSSSLSIASSTMLRASV
eukprot:scaffold3949_cov229-Pinguiococcus_pyrenoidosus.AAC.7